MSEFSPISALEPTKKTDGVFAAAVTAFMALTRPSRREIAQLDDLTVPLCEAASPTARRYVAAALSDSPHAPPRLSRRLCEEPVETAAPLLMRSPILADADLVGLIARKGLGHARAIARRKALNPAIADLIRMLESASDAPAPRTREDAATMPPANLRTDKSGSADSANRLAQLRSRNSVDSVRERLRAMMGPAGAPANPATRQIILRSAAMSGDMERFAAALAEALELPAATGRLILAAGDPVVMAAALRALGCGEDRAFLIAWCANPKGFRGVSDLSAFIARFRRLQPAEALEWLSRRCDGDVRLSSSGERPG